MDEFERAKQRSERLIAKGRMSPSVEPPPVVPIREEKPIPALLVPKPPKGGGKVRIEVRVWLHEEPLVLTYSTEMRGHTLPSQLNRKWLSQKFKDMMKEWRVHDVSGSN
jgi:hypothetical protein